VTSKGGRCYADSEGSTPDASPLLTSWLDEEYEVHGVIGSGGFGTVRLARCRDSGKLCAVKSICKDTFSSRETALREADILRLFNHRGVNRLIETVEDEWHVHLVVDYVQGSDLLSEMMNLGRTEEQRAAQITQQVLAALAHCHEQGIVHRDIKPENIVVQNRDSRPSITLVDFGLAAATGDCLDRTEGTLPYLAPEVLESSCGDRVDTPQDLWSVGIVLYAMLSGKLPTDTADRREDELDLSSIQASDEAKDLLAELLRRDPRERPSACEALEHPWLAKCSVAA
ncbi:unnamed protein product, partial [Polarella glacialis]